MAALAVGLLLLALVVVPAGRSRVPLSRLDPTVAPEASALAGAGAAAGAAVEKVLVKRGRLAAGVAALEAAGMTITLPNFVAGGRRSGPSSAVAAGVLLAGPVVGLLMLAVGARSAPGCS